MPIMFTFGGPITPNSFGVPPTMVGIIQLPTIKLQIVGITTDNTGAPLGNCIVSLYRTADDMLMDRVTSDGSGNYTFSATGISEAYYILAYLAGAPDVAGTSVNTLVGT